MVFALALDAVEDRLDVLLDQDLELDDPIWVGVVPDPVLRMPLEL